MLIRSAIAMVVGLGCVSGAFAQPTVNGTADASYGPALSVQNTQTQFGDNNLGDLIATGNGGSEIDQVFGTVAGGRLYVTVTGNLQNNFNRLEIFFDVDEASGGVNEIIGNQLPAGVDAFCCGGLGASDGALQRMDGLTFDEGFFADYFLSFSHGGEIAVLNSGGTMPFWAISAHFADLTEGTAGRVVRAGMQLGPQGMPNVLRAGGMSGTLTDPAFVPSAATHDTNPTISLIGPALPGLSQGELIDKNYALGAGGCDSASGAGCLAGELEFALPVDTVGDPNNTKSHRDFENTIDVRMALDNSNIEGVSGGAGAISGGDDPQNVLTGIEFSIPLSQLPNFLNSSPTNSIRMAIFVNSSGHEFVANQFAGEGVLRGNFGSLPLNLETEAEGDQFVTLTGQTGDYNGNGTVDAADYVVWRNNMGGDASMALAFGSRDPLNFGPIDQDDYNSWKSHFGETAGSGSGTRATATVPEPTTLVLLMLAAAGWRLGTTQKCQEPNRCFRFLTPSYSYSRRGP